MLSLRRLISPAALTSWLLKVLQKTAAADQGPGEKEELPQRGQQSGQKAATRAWDIALDTHPHPQGLSP